MLHSKIKIVFGLCILSAAIISSTGCYYDKGELLYPNNNQPVICANVPAKFNADVLPLITVKCAIAGCHNAGGAAGGLVFSNYAQINAAKDRIKVRAVDQKSMPASGPLLPAEINTIKCWLDGGALND